MAVTLDTFLRDFPEFEDIACKKEAFVIEKIAKAGAMIDAEFYGVNADTAWGYQAAHLIAISPCGISASLATDTESSSYAGMLDSLKARGFGVRVV